MKKVVISLSFFSVLISVSTFGVGFYYPAFYPIYTHDVIDITYDQHDFINQLAISDKAKKNLYEYSKTPEGQVMLQELMNPSYLGPTGSTINTPSAYAADWGTIAAGFAYANRWPGTRNEDGYANIAFGFGNATQNLGLSVSLLIDSIKDTDDGLAKNGTVTAQLFHVFPNDFAIGIGAGNLIPWGALKHQALSFYAVGTKVLPIEYHDYIMPITLTAGMGTGSFSSVEDYKKNHDAEVRPFVSMGFRIFPKLSLIGEWVAREANIGVSFLPIKSWPVVLGISACNLNERDHKNSYYMATVAFGHNFINK